MYPFFYIFSCRVPAYGAMMALGLLVAGSLGLRRARKAGLRWEDGLVILACGFGTALLGAAGLYLAVTYSPAQLWALICSGELFSENRLGLVFYGGLIFALPGAWLGARAARAKLPDFVCPMLPCLPLGHAFGRLGCLLAGCCYGVPTHLPIGVMYTESYSGVPTGVALFPVQAVESAALLLIFGALVAYTRRRRRPNRVGALYLLLYAPCRFVLEFFRYDAIRGSFFGLSTSQWLSLALFAVGWALCFLPDLAHASARTPASGTLEDLMQP